ncbi:MAG: L-ribulose-5-phosphate 4-epimerase AraD [Armatimonadota bacterium]
MLEALKQTVWQANLDLQRAGLVILTWGNVSGLDAETGLVAIKPSGVSYDEMRPEQMVVVDLQGEVVEGDLRPSSDTPTHLELYRRFPGLGGIAHTHSTAATAWAQAKRPLPCYGTTHADSFHGCVALTTDLTEEALAGDYELETGKAIVAAFEGVEPLRMPGVLVASHGPFTWGATPAKAVESSIVLEQVALMGLMTNALSPDCPAICQGLLDKHFLRKHGAGSYYGQR